MVSFFLALNLVSSIGTLPAAKLNFIYKHLSSEEQIIIDENNITTDDELVSQPNIEKKMSKRAILKTTTLIALQILENFCLANIAIIIGIKTAEKLQKVFQIEHL